MSLAIRGNTRSAPRKRKRPRDDGERNHAEDVAMALLIRQRPMIYSAELRAWANVVLKGGDRAA